MLGRPKCPPEVTLTMEPLFCFIMCGMAWRAVKAVPNTLTDTMARTSASVISSTRARRNRPALFTRPSILP